MSDPSSTSSSDRRGLYFALGLAVVLFGLDVLARVEPPFADLPGDVTEDLHPFARATYDIDPAIVPGMSPHTRFFRNAQGLRGHTLSGANDELLLVGGSTVACTLLDQRDEIGAVIARTSGHRVATLGRGGYPLERLLPLVERVLARDELRPGTLALLVGANEVEMLMNHLPWSDGPAWDVDGPFGPAQRARTYAGWYRPGADGRFLVAPRRAYASSPKRDRLAPVQSRFVAQRQQEFGAQLVAVIRAARERGTNVVLVTQPLAYDVARGMAHPGWAPFFYAEPGAGVLPSPRLLHELLDGFNRVTRSVAQHEGVVLVDLEAQLGECGECFYDQWHFTIAGASAAGGAIAAALE